MFLHKLKILFWKNLHFRKRKWLLTSIEFIIPVILFYYFTREYGNLKRSGDRKIIIKKHNETIEKPRSLDEVIMDDMISYRAQSLRDGVHLNDMGSLNFYKSSVSGNDYNILYMPSNTETDMLVKNVEKSLKYIRFSSVANESEAFKIKYDRSNYIPTILIEFLDVSIKSHKLKYKIRNSQMYKNGLFPQYDEDGPVNSANEYIGSGCLSLQVAIDLAFIELQFKNSNENNRQNTSNIFLQPFPYPSYAINAEQDKYIVLALASLTVMSFAMLCITVLKQVVEEKRTGVKELQKLMGLENWMVWAGWIINSLMVYIFSITIIVIFLKFNGLSPTLSNSDVTVIWIFLMLCCLASIFFCFALSTFFTNPTIAMPFALIFWIGSYFGVSTLLRTQSVSVYMKLLLCLLPNVAIELGFKMILKFENYTVGAQWRSLFHSGPVGTDLSLGVVMLMLIFSCVIYTVITYYIDAIHPGQYGIAKPFHFIITEFFSKSNNNKKNYHNNNDKIENGGKYFEEPPSNLQVGINVQNLRKYFGKVKAVQDVNLKIHKGEITALLGHNGAGKTTTMSVITGMLSPTSGYVYHDNKDVFENIKKFRESIGVCLQHDLHFSFMSVMEHMIFFGMLKGTEESDVRTESVELLKILGIDDKSNSLVDELSGGMKRKLSLAIALVGKPKILMLDEPTSGMDVESRRLVWDLLLNMRGDRSILLTTHYMEEADVLGDRIAIMDHGYIICYGTTMFLKNIFGTGYHVTLLKNSFGNVSKITKLIRDIIPDSEIINDSESEVVYSIPTNKTALFPELFSSIESNPENLGITGIGVSYTTMEEVFVKSGKISESKIITETDVTIPGESINLLDEKINTSLRVTGLKLLIQQFLILSTKRWKYAFRNWFTFLVFVFSILAAAIGTIKLMNSTYLDEKQVPVFTFSLSEYGATEVVLSVPYSNLSFAEAYKNYAEEQSATVDFTNSNIIQTLLKKGEYDILKYRYETITSAFLNEQNGTFLYNTIAYFSIPVAVNQFTVSLLRTISGDKSATIETMTQSLRNEEKHRCPDPSDPTPFFIWIIFFMDIVMFTFYFVYLPHMERVTGVRHVQIMSKLSKITYWVTLFFNDLLLYIVLIASALLGMLIIDSYGVFTGVEEISVLFTILFLYGINAILYCYLFSYLFDTINTNFSIFLILNIIVNMIVTTACYVMKQIFTLAEVKEYNFWYKILHLLLLIPPFNLLCAIFGFVGTMWHNNYCSICTTQEEHMCKTDSKNYFVIADEYNNYGILTEIIFFLVSILLFTTILIFINNEACNKLWNKLIVRIYKPTTSSNSPSSTEDGRGEDPDINEEKKRVTQAKNSKESNSEILLITDNLVKNYIKNFHKFTAVGGVNFTVSKGECFGLLGINGAGKSTTFKMLTAELIATSGDALIRGKKLSNQKKAYLSLVGYCPQENNIIDVLTGKEMLQLLCLLRGVHPNYLKSHVDKWTSILGLEEYSSKRSGTYSGGNKRKLCAAMALIGDPEVVFLDEPTTGVDPVSRRNLYDVMKNSKIKEQAVILTSHSMEECEILCDRLTIMAGGRMKCIGSVQYLKQRYAQGFTVMIKLQESKDDGDRKISNLKEDIKTHFKNECILKDEHTGLLHYSISNSKYLWSNLFGIMERLQKRHEIITEYTVSDTTLEQVFLSIAKAHSEK